MFYPQRLICWACDLSGMILALGERNSGYWNFDA